MTQEEKLKEAKRLYKTANSDQRYVLESLFPELKESEDEKIRREMITYLSTVEDKELIPYESWIAWIKKQGESVEINPDEIIEECHQDNADHIIDIVTEQQKPVEWSEEDAIRLQRIIDFLWYNRKGDTDTIYQQELDIDWLKSFKDRVQSKQSSKPQGKSALEAIKEEKVDKPFDYENANIVQKDFVPKFEFGDWIVQENIGVYQVIQVCESWYEAVDNKGKGYSIGFDKEHMLRLWTINDAQDGDVLVASDGPIFIFAGVVDCACKYYITLTATNDVKINKEKKGGYWETSRAVYPATKEQRDLLFQKMKESGWGFDFEKKELKKIMEK